MQQNTALRAAPSPHAAADPASSRQVAAGIAATALPLNAALSVTPAMSGLPPTRTVAQLHSMKVDKTSGLRGSAPARRSDKVGAGGGTFARHLDETSATAPAAGPGGVSATSGIAGILSLQEVDDATTSRKRAVRHAETLLDRLDELRHGLLMGTLSRSQLEELARLVALRRGAENDGALNGLLADIDLRVQVEIAKYEANSAG
jgi:Class II flagellar assembly regulator